MKNKISAKESTDYFTRSPLSGGWPCEPRAGDIRCPKCAGHAVYFWNLCRGIWKKTPIEIIRKWAETQSQPFKLEVDRGCKGWWRLTWFPAEIRKTEEGVYWCPNCMRRRAHSVDWSKDAWYQVDVFEKGIWAINRKLFEWTKDYLASQSRSEFVRQRGFGADYPLRRLPRKLMSSKYRKKAVLAISECLQG